MFTFTSLKQLGQHKWNKEMLKVHRGQAQEKKYHSSLGNGWLGSL